MRNRTSYSNANMVGQRIRSLREKQGLSQGELLARIQVQATDLVELVPVTR